MHEPEAMIGQKPVRWGRARIELDRNTRDGELPCVAADTRRNELSSSSDGKDHEGTKVLLLVRVAYTFIFEPWTKSTGSRRISWHSRAGSARLEDVKPLTRPPAPKDRFMSTGFSFASMEVVLVESRPSTIRKHPSADGLNPMRQSTLLNL